LARCHALIVDDDADARFLTGQLLTARGAQVTVVGSARDALNAMKQKHFDVIVADIGMPGEDGYALIRAVRALTMQEGGRTPAVAMTAYASLRDREQALVAGFDWHVPKPVDPEALVDAIANAISPARPVPPAQPHK
jgi:CheY-like chemotaxis protein